MTSTRTTALALTLTLAAVLGGCAPAMGEAVAEETQSEEVAPASSIRNVSVAEADALIGGDAPVTVLDVRTPGEFAAGHIEGAVNVDFRSPDFAEQLAKLDPGQTYVLHCKSGTRSAQALEVMKEQGFADIAHMNEGFDGWQESGKAIAR